MANEVSLLTPKLGVPFFTAHADIALYKSLGLSCVYAIGPQRGRPLNVGWAAAPSGLFSNIRNASYEELELHDIVWTPGPPIAKRLIAEVHRILDKAGKRIRGDWFDLTTELIVPTIYVATQNLRVPTFTHSGMLDLFASTAEARTAAALRRVGA